jgi:hypothetical protein
MKKIWLDISGLFLMIENPLHINIFPLIKIPIQKKKIKKAYLVKKKTQASQ